MKNVRAPRCHLCKRPIKEGAQECEVCWPNSCDMAFILKQNMLPIGRYANGQMIFAGDATQQHGLD